MFSLFIFLALNFYSYNFSIESENSKKFNKNKWTKLVENSINSVAQIITFSNLFNWCEPYKTPEQRLSFGSCFFIDEFGYLLTNAHCVMQGEVFYLQLPFFGKNRFEAKILAICPERDLALLRLTKESFERLIKELGEIKYLEIGDSDKIDRAEEIMALGFPLGQEWLKSTLGIVSGMQMLDNRQYIQIDTPINRGNSGGPALNNFGEVIGINTCVITANSAQNIGYILPSKEINIFLDQIKHLRNLSFDEIENRPVELIEMPRIGIVYHGSPEAIIKFLNNPLPGGAYIAEVFKDGLMDEFGLKADDMIYEIIGYKVDRFGEITVPWSDDKISMASFLNQIPVGMNIDILVYRKGEKLLLSGEWKIKNKKPIRYFYPPYETIDYIIISGIVIMPLTLNHVQIFQSGCPDLIEYLKEKNQLNNSLIISHVLPNSIAEKSRILSAGMIIKEINGLEVKTISEAEEAILLSKETGFLTIKMKSGEFFVGLLNDILKNEDYLSMIYFYNPSKIINQLY